MNSLGKMLFLPIILTITLSAQAGQIKDASPENARVFLELVNTARTESRFCGDIEYQAVEPLKWQNKLAAAAQSHLHDISNGRFSHTGSDGSEVWNRVKRHGYSYRTVAENIAMNPMGAASTVEMWLNSPGHCSNIMNPNFTELGAETEGNYSVMVFGTR